MAYLGDPREQAIDIDNHVIWENDNRIEERWQWGAKIDDLCDMSPEEYMKNPLIEAVKAGGSGGGSGADCECIQKAAETVVSAVNSAVTTTNTNRDNNTDRIIEAIKTLSGGTGPMKDEVLFYYGQVNHQTDPMSITKSIFQPSIVMVGSETFVDFILGDPDENDWQDYLNGAITEQQLRELSCNDYYLAMPVAYDGKFALLENGTVDITNNFVKVEGLSLYDGYYIYRSVDIDYFNEDYEDGEVNVKIPFKITITN